MSDLRKKFGELLKLERERKGIKLEALAEQLKISLTYLESIESGDLRNLPSELYYGLFAKSYAESIGVDYAATMDAMKAELEEPAEIKEAAPNGAQGRKKVREDKAPEEAREPKSPDEGSGILKWLLYIFGGLALLFVIFLVINHFFFSTRSTSEATTPTQSNVTTEQSGQSQEDLDAAVANFNWDDTLSYEVPSKIKLSLVAVDQSWSTIVADGDTALFRNLIPGRQYDVEATFRMLVSIGIPSVVKVTLNGQPVDLADPQSGRISRVEISQANLHQFLGGPTSSGDKSIEPGVNQTPVQPSEDTVKHGGTGDEH